MDVIDQNQLITSAREWARRALDAYLADDQSVILVNAAISLEHLSKAFLCWRNPALLIDLSRKDFDSLLHLCGLSEYANPDRRLKTVSGTEAFGRTKQMLPSMFTSTKLLDTLFDIRNSAVHAGQLPGVETHDVLAAFLRATSSLHNVMKLDPNIYWGEHAGLVNKLISESLTGAEREAHTRVAAAQQRFSRLLEQVPESQWKRLVKAREAEFERTGSLGQRFEDVRCPACSHYATCVGRRLATKVPEDEDPWGITVTFYAAGLSCPVCLLRLDDAEQLRAVGLKADWEVSPDLFELSAIASNEEDERDTTASPPQLARHP